MPEGRTLPLGLADTQPVAILPAPSARVSVPAREPLFKANALLHALAIAALMGIGVAAWILFVHGGWDYYRTPVAVRGYTKQHAFLRPSGPGGNLLGVVGTFFMVLTLLYVVRKKFRFLAKVGSMKGWLEFHIFCGLFGPILITFHTAMKFNGIISVAYWSMVLVVLSGFVGRYLFVRIPKTIRGHELSRAEIEERAREMKHHLAEASFPAQLLLRIEQVEREIVPAEGAPHGFLALMAGDLRARKKMAALRGEIKAAGLGRALVHDALDTVHERAALLRRIAQLQQTRRLFEMWHVFHRPLVWIMFTIFGVHLAVALFFGYTIFGR